MEVGTEKPKYEGKIYDPRKEWMKAQEDKALVTRSEFDKRVNAGSRLDALEGELTGMRSMLNEIVKRLNDMARTKPKGEDR